MINNQLKNLPTSPGVYLYRNKKGKVIYVGKAKNLRDRVRSYFREGEKRRKAKIVAIQKNAVDVETIITNELIPSLFITRKIIKNGTAVSTNETRWNPIQNR